MPVTESGPYSVPVMARRDLHGEHHSYTSNSSTLSSPTRFMSNVRSQLVNSYSALRDRLTQHDQPAPLLDSPSARYSRSSSNTATSYNRAPVHSTPRPVGDDEEQQKKSQKSKKTTEEEKNQHDDEKSNILVRVLRAPFDLLSAIWHKFFSLPWWLLIPLLLFLGFYACKFFSLSLLSSLFIDLLFSSSAGLSSSGTLSRLEALQGVSSLPRVRSQCHQPDCRLPS